MSSEHHNEAHTHAHHHNTDVHSEHCGCGCGANHGDAFEKNKKYERGKIIFSAVFFLAGLIVSELAPTLDFVYLLCFLVSYAVVGFSVIREALEDIINGNVFGECFLISIASVGAFSIKEYSEGCAVMLLFAVGEYIQSAALSKSRAAIRKISDEHGFEHSHSNSDTERFISKFAKIYTPVICLLAMLIIVIPPLFLNGEWKEWIYRGLSALVIGCPCAIVISVPLAFSCAMGACTKQGIFVHCSDALEKLNKNQEEAPEEIVIPDHSLEKLALAKAAAKKAVLISRENIVFAVAVKLVILVLAVFLDREVPIWLAEFGDIGVAIIAILNSLRALRIKN